MFAARAEYHGIAIPRRVWESWIWGSKRISSHIKTLAMRARMYPGMCIADVLIRDPIMLPPEIDFPESSAVASCCVVLPTQAGVAAQPTTCAYTPVHSGVGISNLKEGGGCSLISANRRERSIRRNYEFITEV